MMLRRHLLSSMTTFRYFYKIWFGFKADKLLHLLMAFLNSFLEKGSHSMVDFDEISSNRLGLTWWFYIKLNVWYNAYYILSILIQRCLLYCSTSIAGNLHFLIQLLRSQDLWYFDMISWILSLKNKYLVFLTTSLKIFQFSIILKDLYLVSLSWHLLFHHALKHLVILTYHENLYQVDSEILIYSQTIDSRDSLSAMPKMLIFPIVFLSSEIKFYSILLFLIMMCYLS